MNYAVRLIKNLRKDDMKLKTATLGALLAALTACGGDNDSSLQLTDLASPPPDVISTSFSVAPLNSYFPIPVGLTYIYEPAEDVEGLEDFSIHISFSADSKITDGVSTIAMFEREYSGGELLEETTSQIAIDSEGAVWIFSEKGVEYQDGAEVGIEIWIAGEFDAKRARLMSANPEVGETFITENIEVDETETAEVLSVDEILFLESGDDEPAYIDVLHVLETDSDGEASADYFYAPGVGLVKFIDDDVTMVLAETDSNVGIAEDLEEESLPESSDDYQQFAHLSINFNNAKSQLVMVFEADTGIEEISVWDPKGRLILELEVNEIDEVGLSEMTFVFSPVEDEFEEGVYTILADTIEGENVFGEIEL